MADNKSKLNNMNPAAKYADLGDKLDAIIVLLTEVKSGFNTHVHGAGVVPDALLTSAVPDPLN